MAALIWGLAGLALTPLVLRAIEALPAKGQTSDAQPPRSRRRTVLVACALAIPFAWVAWRHGATAVTLALSVYSVIFVIIAGIDIDHHLILNRVLAPAALFALGASFILPAFTPALALFGAAVGLVVMLIPALVMPGGLGFGDVKLAGFLGLATGFPAVLTALTAGILAGGVVTAALLLTHRIGRRDYIPYGPFLLAGAAFVLLQW